MTVSRQADRQRIICVGNEQLNAKIESEKKEEKKQKKNVFSTDILLRDRKPFLIPQSLFYFFFFFLEMPTLHSSLVFPSL